MYKRGHRRELAQGRWQPRVYGPCSRAQVAIQDVSVAVTSPLTLRIRVPHLERTEVIRVVHKLRGHVAVVEVVVVEAVNTGCKIQAQ